jgi:nucleoid DNA-binding protein
MNGTDMVSAIADRTGIPREQVKEVLDTLTALVLEALGQGEEVSLRGLGSFGARWQEPRSLRSVQDQRRLVLDGRWVPRFRPASALREALLQGSPQRWRDPRHQAAWRLAEALVGDLDLYQRARAPKLDEDTPLPMVASICAVAFGATWERVIQTWNAQVPAEIRADGDHLLRVAQRRWRAREDEGAVAEAAKP